MLTRRRPALVEIVVALRPVDRDERDPARTGRRRRRGPRPRAGARGDRRAEDHGDQRVRELDRGGEAEQVAGGDAQRQARRRSQDEREADRDECRRERLRVQVQADVDVPLAVLPGALARSGSRDERPGRVQRRGDAGRPSGGRSRTGRCTRWRRRWPRSRAARARGRAANATSTRRFGDEPVRRQRDRPDERPADDRRARRLISCTTTAAVSASAPPAAEQPEPAARCSPGPAHGRSGGDATTTAVSTSANRGTARARPPRSPRGLRRSTRTQSPFNGA